MKFTVRWPDPAELLDRAQEKTVTLFAGAARLEIDAHERIPPLRRYTYDVRSIGGDILGQVGIDIYPDNTGELVAEIEIDDRNVTPLAWVYTSREAAALWKLSENTVTQWCNRHRFLPSEARRSEKVWIVTHAGMVRLTGREPNES